MQIGDCVYMTSCEIVSPDGNARVRYNAPKGQRFVFLLLGADQKDNSKPLDPDAQLKAMGFVPNLEP